MSDMTEGHRHNCEVRHIKSLSVSKQTTYLDTVRTRRGEDAYERLEKETRTARAAKLRQSKPKRNYRR